MKKNILYSLLFTLVFSINAGAIPVSTTPTTHPVAHPLPSVIAKWLDGHKKKLNFFERIIYKMTMKKLKKAMAKANDKPIDADKLARQAHTFGWLSLLTFFIFPLASIPLAVLAISKSGMALEQNTTLAQKARTGRTVGIVTLGLIAALIALIIAIIAGISMA